MLTIFVVPSETAVTPNSPTFLGGSSGKRNAASREIEASASDLSNAYGTRGVSISPDQVIRCREEFIEKYFVRM